MRNHTINFYVEQLRGMRSTHKTVDKLLAVGWMDKQDVFTTRRIRRKIGNGMVYLHELIW